MVTLLSGLTDYPYFTELLVWYQVPGSYEPCLLVSCRGTCIRLPIALELSVVELLKLVNSSVVVKPVPFIH